MTFFDDIEIFVSSVGSVVSNLTTELGQVWRFYFYAICIMIVLSVLRQVGYRNGD